MKQGIFARALAENSNEQIIDIIGVIGWEVGYQTLRELIRAIPESVKAVTFDIYSPGGDVWEGNGIVQEIGSLSKRGIKTKANIQVAASMATLIALACDERSIASNGRFLIHNAWSAVQGDAAQMEKMAKTLRDCEQEAAKFYAERTGKKADDMLKLMAEERWLMPDEVLALGFVQKVCDPFKPEEYSAVKQEIIAAGKWPKALVELPAEPKEQEHADNSNTDTLTLPADAAGKPDNSANASEYIKRLAESEATRAEEQAKYSAQLAKCEKLIKEHQSAKDKAEVQILALKDQLNKLNTEFEKFKADGAAYLSETKKTMTDKHAAEILELTNKHTKEITSLNSKLSGLAESLKDANDRNSKLVNGAMTFQPSVETWAEAMAACSGDYATAAKRYPDILSAFIKSANTKGQKK